VAEHSYTFEVAGGYQEFSMSCDLCGLGEDSSSVMPHDPRKAQQLF
jgi:hypothetical protein